MSTCYPTHIFETKLLGLQRTDRCFPVTGNAEDRELNLERKPAWPPNTGTSRLTTPPTSTQLSRLGSDRTQGQHSKSGCGTSSWVRILAPPFTGTVALVILLNLLAPQSGHLRWNLYKREVQEGWETEEAQPWPSGFQTAPHRGSRLLRTPVNPCLPLERPQPGAAVDGGGWSRPGRRKTSSP